MWTLLEDIIYGWIRKDVGPEAIPKTKSRGNHKLSLCLAVRCLIENQGTRSLTPGDFHPKQSPVPPKIDGGWKRINNLSKVQESGLREDQSGVTNLTTPAWLAVRWSVVGDESTFLREGRECAITPTNIQVLSHMTLKLGWGKPKWPANRFLWSFDSPLTVSRRDAWPGT